MDIVQVSIDIMDDGIDENKIKDALTTAGIKVVGMSCTERWTEAEYGYDVKGAYNEGQ